MIKALSASQFDATFGAFVSIVAQPVNRLPKRLRFRYEKERKGVNSLFFHDEFVTDCLNA